MSSRGFPVRILGGAARKRRINRSKCGRTLSCEGRSLDSARHEPPRPALSSDTGGTQMGNATQPKA